MNLIFCCRFFHNSKGVFIILCTNKTHVKYRKNWNLLVILTPIDRDYSKYCVSMQESLLNWKLGSQVKLNSILIKKNFNKMWKISECLYIMQNMGMQWLISLHLVSYLIFKDQMVPIKKGSDNFLGRIWGELFNLWNLQYRIKGRPKANLDMHRIMHTPLLLNNT